jgi:hypothetical protein
MILEELWNWFHNFLSYGWFIMIFLMLKAFLKLIKEFLKNKNINQWHMEASGHAMWHADVSMTSARGSASADVNMAYADVSVER